MSDTQYEHTIYTKLEQLCGDGENEITKVVFKGKACGNDKIIWNSMRSVDKLKEGVEKKNVNGKEKAVIKIGWKIG